MFIVIAGAAAVCFGMYWLFVELGRTQAQIDALEQKSNELTLTNSDAISRIEALESELSQAMVSSGAVATVCETGFPSGLYVLKTSTSYSVSSETDEYEIDHVSTQIGDWQVNAGISRNSYGVPNALYFDYNRDGKIDTSIAVRLAREIPFVGNSIADRLLANSDDYQNLYAVFSCEWGNADFTSTADMANNLSDSSEMLWNLVQEYTVEIADWIESADEP